MAKCVKEKQVEDKLSTTTSGKTASLFPPPFMPHFMPQNAYGWPHSGITITSSIVSLLALGKIAGDLEFNVISAIQQNTQSKIARK